MRRLAFLLAALPAMGLSQVTVIKAGRLLDPATGKVSQNQVILVERDRIRMMGPDVQIPSGAKVVDLSASTVMPGLFDCHTHMAMRINRSEYASNSLQLYDIFRTSASRALDGVANCREMLEAGFTTIRDVGNSGKYIDVDLMRAINRGLIDGPTIIPAGRIIAPFGGQYNLQPERAELLQPEYFPADTRDEILKAVRENIHYGAQVIKIVVDDQRYIYSAEDIKLFVEEAAKAGLKVCAHSLTATGTRNAILGGVASIEHGFDMPDDVLKLAKEKNVYLVSTDLTPRVWEEYRMPEAAAKNLYASLIDRLKRARAIGVKIAFGSDLVFNIPEINRGQWTLSLLDGFVQAGYTNAEILQILVPNAADLCGVAGRRGSIALGKAADLIAMPGNPLEDIKALNAVSFVMKNGKVVKGG